MVGMAMARETALRIRRFLDNWLPPVLRDSRLVMYPLMFAAFRGNLRDFADFKQHGFAMSAEAFADVYRKTAAVSEIQGATDLNEACTEATLEAVEGDTVLEAGCGRGYLAGRLTEVAKHVTACDIVLHPGLESSPNLEFHAASVEALPYPDDSFDTVVCTHTLEHVQDIHRALAELRRVARKRLIVVVPRERPYRYSFNLHLHFFPYLWSWQAVAGAVSGATLTDLDDWFYVEPVQVS